MNLKLKFFELIMTDKNLNLPRPKHLISSFRADIHCIHFNLRNAIYLFLD